MVFPERFVLFFSGELEGAHLSRGAVLWPCLQMAVVTFLQAVKGWDGAHPSWLLLSRLHGTTSGSIAVFLLAALEEKEGEEAGEATTASPGSFAPLWPWCKLLTTVNMSLLCDPLIYGQSDPLT